MTRLFAGAASPIGWGVQFIEAPFDDVVAEVAQIRAEAGIRHSISDRIPYPEILRELPPFEAPWTREIVIDGHGWSVYLNNGIDGGDSTAIGPAVARSLSVRCVVAKHTPAFGPGHAATQLWVLGPDGEPPLGYRRTISAHATDGRWRWHDSGESYAFEDVARYKVRRVRDRFDRELLLQYLEQLGVPVDDNEYGDGVAIRQVVSWPVRQVTVEETLAQLR